MFGFGIVQTDHLQQSPLSAASCPQYIYYGYYASLSPQWTWSLSQAFHWKTWCLWAQWQEKLGLDVMFSLDIGPSPFLIILSSISWSLLPYHTQITSDCLVLLSYPLSPPIVNRPLHYLVADSLSFYPCYGSYHVWYISSQSSGTIGIGLCPLLSCYFSGSSPQQYIRCTNISLGP